MIIRQGDVLLVPVAETPTAAKPVAAENGRLILARGEATGHHHSFPIGPRVAMFRDDGGAGGRTFLSVFGAPANLEHQEHTALEVPPGNYEVRLQRVYAAGMARQVQD